MVLVALGPHLELEQSKEVFNAALSAAKSIANDDDRSRALAALAPYLTMKQLSEALTAIKDPYNPYEGSKTLAALIPYLTAELKEQLLGEALARR